MIARCKKSHGSGMHHNDVKLIEPSQAWGRLSPPTQSPVLELWKLSDHRRPGDWGLGLHLVSPCSPSEQPIGSYRVFLAMFSPKLLFFTQVLPFFSYQFSFLVKVKPVATG